MTDSIKILYVDDYDLDRQLVRDVLNRERGPYRLSEARTAEEFKRCLAAAAYDLVLSDFNILGYTGLQVLEAVQAKDPDLPVIIVTGTGSEEIAVKALKQGAADYVIKTAEHIRRLPETIQHVLESKRLELEKQATEAQLHFQATILENVRDAVQVTDLEGQTLYWNKGAEDIFGYTAAEMMGRTPALLYPNQDPAQLEIDLQQILAGQDYRGEWQGRRKDGTTVWVDVLTTVMHNAAGDAVGFIGVSKDITARKQAEDALRQSEERYVRAAKAGRVGIWDWNLETDEMYIDPHLKAMLGYANHEIENHLDDWGQRVHPDDVARVMYEAQNHIEGRTTRYEVEHRMLHKDGHVRWFLAQGMVVRDDTGRAISMVGSDTDITQRKEAELARRESQIQLQLIIQAANAGLWDWDIEANTVYYSPEWNQQLGYADHELSGDFDAWQHLIHPDDRACTLATLRAYLEKPWPDYQDEFRLRHKDGTYRWIMARGTLFIGQTGKSRRMLGLHLDITGRKQAEESLRESERRLSTLMSNLPGMAYRCRNDRNWTMEFVSDGCRTLTGYSQADLLAGSSITYGQLIHADDRERVWQTVQDGVSNHQPFEIIYRIFAANRQEKWVWERGQAVLIDDDQPTFLEGFVTDITGHKQMELALQETNERLQAIVQASPLAIVALDRAGRVTVWSPAAEQLFGWSAGEVIGQPYPLAPEEKQAEFQQNLRTIWDGKVILGMEIQRQHKDGTLLDLRLDTAPLHDAAGSITGVMAIFTNITNRKRTETALRQSEERLELAVAGSKGGVWELVFNPNERHAMPDEIYISPQLKQLIGFEDDEFPNSMRAWQERILPEDLPHLRTSAEKHLAGKTALYEVEYRIRHKDGSLRWIYSRGKIHRNETGGLRCWSGVDWDITDKKRNEQALREGETKYRNLVETAHDLIWSIDAEGRITFINRAAERIYGRKPEEMIGRLYTDFIPPEQIARNAETWMTAINNQDRVVNFENWVLHRDGTPVLLNANAILLRDKHENIIGSTGTSQDITQRKQTEESLQQYASRLEILHQIDRAILAARSVDETVMRALSRLVEIVPCDRADVSLFDLLQQTVERIAVYSQGKTTPGQGFQIPVAETLLDLNLLRQGKYQEVEDYQTLDGLPARLQAIITQLGMRAAIVAPLIANNELVGLIGLGRAEPGHFAAEETDILREVADQLAIAIRQAWLFEAERDQRELAEALSDTARVLNSTLDVEQVLDDILANAGHVVPHSAGDVLLVDAKGIVSIARQKKYDEYGQAEWASKRFFPLEDFPVLETIAKSRNSQVIPDTYADPDWVIVPETAWIRSYVCAPIFKRKELFGFISLSHTSPGFYNTVHAERLQSFAEQAGFALQNAYLYEQTQRHAEELEQRVAERTAELRQFYRQQAIVEERQRLARDLHDAVSQTLFSAGLLAEAIPRLWERHPEQARRSLQDLRRLNRGALAEMRNLLLELRPAALEEARLAEMLRQLVDALAGRVQIETVLHVEDDIAVPAEVQLALYRITQEALNNIAKHARARRVEVTLLLRSEDQVTLTIRDDGRGFAPQLVPPGHLGLSIMRERAEEIGARLDITSQPGQGTEVVVTWPGD